MLPASAYEALELPTETVRVLTNPRPPSPSAASPNLLQNAREPDQSLAPNESSITLYAELLLHIRAITLFASLRTVHTRETNAKLSTDGSRLTVSHEGQSATIRLPIKVKGGGDAALSLPAQPPSKELSLRLQIEEKDDSDLLGTLQSEERKANIVPWDGAFLAKSKHVEIHCRSCQQVIITKGRIEEWRDLPNENWAEMMDFWHCHKPDEHHLHDHTHETVVGKKGYAAGNRLRAIGKIGFIDLTGFLLKEHDCEGVEVGYSKSSGLSHAELQYAIPCLPDLPLWVQRRRPLVFPYEPRRYIHPRKISSTHLTRNAVRALRRGWAHQRCGGAARSFIAIIPPDH